MDRIIELNLEKATLYGWASKVSQQVVDNMVDGIESGNKI